MHLPIRPDHSGLPKSNESRKMRNTERNRQFKCKRIELTYEQQLDEALEHRRTLHEALVSRAAEYRAGVGLYKRRLEEFDASIEDVERKLYRAMHGLQAMNDAFNQQFYQQPQHHRYWDERYDQPATCSTWENS